MLQKVMRKKDQWCLPGDDDEDADKAIITDAELINNAEQESSMTYYRLSISEIPSIV